MSALHCIDADGAVEGLELTDDEIDRYVVSHVVHKRLHLRGSEPPRFRPLHLSGIHVELEAAAAAVGVSIPEGSDIGKNGFSQSGNGKLLTQVPSLVVVVVEQPAVAKSAKHIGGRLESLVVW